MITPFSAQARLLESLLVEAGVNGWASSTVHRFQGDERDIVIYDTVDTGNGVAKLHPWFTDDSAEKTGPRLLNVAASEPGTRPSRRGRGVRSAAPSGFLDRSAVAILRASA